MVAWSPYRSSNRYWSHDPFPPIKALPNSFVMQIYFPPIRGSRINCVRRAYDTTIIPIPHPGGLGPFSCLSYNLDPFWPCYLPAVTDFFSPKISPTSARKKTPLFSRLSTTTLLGWRSLIFRGFYFCLHARRSFVKIEGL